MLPAIELPAKPGVGHTFTRRPDWVAPLESLWSILSKWQFANRVPYSCVAAAILARPYPQADAGVDLRVCNVFDLNALAEHTGVAAAALARGACGGSHETRVLVIASEYLRYCRACMKQGFHATLFQFMLIARCPIHLQRLRDACPNCAHRIAYRLDASFLGHPFACPHCNHPWLEDPRILARNLSAATPNDAVVRWQHYIGAYAYWYADGTRPLRDPQGRFVPSDIARRRILQELGFIARLQQRLRLPPPLPLVARANHLPRSRPHRLLPIPPQIEPCFSRDAWRHFHSRPFIKLYQRYVRAVQLLQRRDTIHSQPVTHWWRRSWEGAVAQPLAESNASPFPPFGIAEWLGFVPHPMPRPKPSEPYRSLAARFEQDLQDTWEAWRQLLADLDPSALRALHPRLIPPRACWLKPPTFEAGTPALGFV